jgi:uncharacterized membrane protein YbhN (UPF0104 family)
MDDKKKRVLFSVLRISVSVGLLWMLVCFADLGKICRSLCVFQIRCLPLVFGAITLSVLISALKWGLLLEAQGSKINLISLFRIYTIALFFNNFLPSSLGGDGARVVLAGRSCDRVAMAAASVVVERAIATISLALLGLIGAVFAEKPYPLAEGLLGALLAVGILITCILLTGWIPGFVRKQSNKIADSWIHFSESAGELKKHPTALIANLALALLFQIIVALVVALVIGGLKLPIPRLFDLFFITAAASVLAMVPIGINGYGLREGTYIVLLRPLGFTASAAVAVSVLFALFVSVFSLIGGIDLMISRPMPKTINVKGDGYE